MSFVVFILHSQINLQPKSDFDLFIQIIIIILQAMEYNYLWYPLFIIPISY